MIELNSTLFVPNIGKQSENKMIKDEKWMDGTWLKGTEMLPLAAVFKLSKWCNFMGVKGSEWPHFLECGLKTGLWGYEWGMGTGWSEICELCCDHDGMGMGYASLVTYLYYFFHYTHYSMFTPQNVNIDFVDVDYVVGWYFVVSFIVIILNVFECIHYTRLHEFGI